MANVISDETMEYVGKMCIRDSIKREKFERYLDQATAV